MKGEDVWCWLNDNAGALSVLLAASALVAACAAARWAKAQLDAVLKEEPQRMAMARLELWQSLENDAALWYDYWNSRMCDAIREGTGRQDEFLEKASEFERERQHCACHRLLAAREAVRLLEANRSCDCRTQTFYT